MKEFNKTQELLKLRIKQNKNTYIKRISIILSCVILVIGVLYFTFAKFESNKSYTLIQGKLGDYSSGDLTISAIIDGVSSSSFPENNGLYLLTNIECSDSNGSVNVNYDENTWHITDLGITKKTKCTYYFIEREEWLFDYKTDSTNNGTYQEFIVPKSGSYKIELWGAEGEDNPYAGYTSGEIILNKSQKIFVYVGQKGIAYSEYNNASYRKNTFNGGGVPGTYSNTSSTIISSRQGGGATDIRYFGESYTPTSSDLEWNSTLGLRSRIMIAAGAGGGAMGYSYHTYAGGLTGYSGSGTTTPGTGGSQTAGGSRNGSFGIGGSGSYYQLGAGSGGSGYFGGGAGQGSSNGKTSSGGSGSSFISGHTGCVAITSASDQSPKSGCTTGTTDNNCSIHYSGLKFTNTKMIDGKGYPWTNVVGTTHEKMPKPEGGYYDEGKGHTGNGYARITYLGE